MESVGWVRDRPDHHDRRLFSYGGGKIRQLSRLETVVYSLDKIVEGDRENAILPGFLAGDKLLLIAHGEVIAGIDLAQLKSGDVEVNGDAVQVRLPAAQILTTRSITHHAGLFADDGAAGFYRSEPGIGGAADGGKADCAGSLDDGILDKARQKRATALPLCYMGWGFASGCAVSIDWGNCIQGRGLDLGPL